MIKYGLYDEQDDCWIGTNEGPLLYDDEILARLAAEVAEVQLGYHNGRRIRHSPYYGGADQLKDELPTKMTPTEAIRRLERGLI